jgi:hypothetical protein
MGHFGWASEEAIQSFRASRCTRAFGRAVASCGRGFDGTRERVPFRPLDFLGNGGSGRAYARCPHLRIEMWGTRLEYT